MHEKESPFPSAFAAICLQSQFPIDVNHSEAKGMAGRHQDLFHSAILKESAVSKFSEAFQRLELPPTWSKLGNPTTHRGSYGFTEIAHYALLLPYLIRLLDDKNLKSKAVLHIQEEFGAEPDFLHLPSAVEKLTFIYCKFAECLSCITQDTLLHEEQDTISEFVITLDMTFVFTHSCRRIKDTRKLFVRLVPCLPNAAEQKRSLESSNLHIGLHLHCDV